MMRRERKDKKPSAYEFRCGAVHRVQKNESNHVAISWQHCCYLIQGFIDNKFFREIRLKNKDAWAVFNKYKRQL